MIRDFSAHGTYDSAVGSPKPSPIAKFDGVSSIIVNLRLMGPGIVWAVAAIGSGELIISAKVGAEYGTVFLWALWVGVWAKYWIHRAVLDLTISTGRPVPDLWSESRFGRFISLYWIVFFLLTSAGLAGLIGLAASIAFMMVPQFGMNACALVVGTALVAMSYFEDYNKFEKTMLVFAFLIAAGVLTTVVLASPEPTDIVAWTFPQNMAGGLIFLSIFGWGAGSGPDLILPYSWWVLENESKQSSSGVVRKLESTINLQEIRKQRFKIGNYNLIAGYVCTGIVASAFMVVGATVLRPRGIVVEGVDVLRRISLIFTDLYGEWASIVFLIGMFAALFSTAFGVLDGGRTVLMQASRSLMNRSIVPVKQSRTHPASRIALILFAIIALIVLAFGKSPVALLMCASVISAISMPLLGALTLWGLFRHLPKESRPSVFSVANLVLSVLVYVVLMIKVIWYWEIIS